MTDHPSGGHLHLTYTRSYWTTFCGEVLRAPLHHAWPVPAAAELASAGRQGFVADFRGFADWGLLTPARRASIFGHVPFSRHRLYQRQHVDDAP